MGEMKAMLPIHTILYPTDFSDRARCAFDMACSLARDYQARLIVLHVYPEPMTHGEALARQQDDGYHQQLWDTLHAYQPSDPSIETEFWLEEGEAAHVIVDVARERKCDLIILGTHGRSGLRRLLMGSVAEQVLRAAHCPVLTIKAQPRMDAGGRKAERKQEAPMAEGPGHLVT